MIDKSTAPRSFRFASLSSCLIALGLCCASVAARDLRIEHVTIVSPERLRPMREATVYIQGDRIVSISRRPPSGSARSPGTAVEIIDGQGLYLAPGLIDSHVHLNEIPGMTDEQEKVHPDIASAARGQIPRSFLYLGFTTLIDLISTPETMARWKSHDIAPDTYFCGGAALIDSYPMNYMPKPVRYQCMPYMIVEPGADARLPPGVDAAAHSPQAAVAHLKSDGAICVKTFFERGFGGVHELPVPRLETIRALVIAAHAAGLPVLMHANSAEAQSFGLDAGVDILAHGLWNWNDPSSTIEVTPAVRAVLDRVVETKIGWQATIQVLYGVRDLFSTSFLSDPALARVLPSSLIAWYGTKEGTVASRLGCRHANYRSQGCGSPNELRLFGGDWQG